MKTSIFIISLMLITFFSPEDFLNTNTIKKSKSTTESNLNTVLNYQDIVFILGDDKEKDNRYYELANKYYQNDTSKRVVITSCRSLKCVRDYLDNNLLNIQTKWGKIDLIVHSNQWTGLGVPVFDNGKRSTSFLLEKAVKEGKFKPLDKFNLDSTSKMTIYGCGFGKNITYMQQLKNAFGISKINASDKFIVYNDHGDKTERFEAESYYGFFKTGYRPANYKLRNQMKKRYPEIEIDWLPALTRKKPRYFGDPYHYFMNVPVEWIVTYSNENERPKLKSEPKKEEWIKSQSELMKVIEKTEIPFDKFRWQLKNINYTFEDGVTEPAIKIQGKSSVLFILKVSEK